jgi:putative GTP pyrophosphokinase
MQALFDFERADPGKDIVLVRADKTENIRTVFRNYFSDATEFVRLIEDGCKVLGDQDE